MEKIEVEKSVDSSWTENRCRKSRETDPGFCFLSEKQFMTCFYGGTSNENSACWKFLTAEVVKHLKFHVQLVRFLKFSFMECGL